NGPAGDPYNGLDLFGRVSDQRWLKFDDINNPLDRFQYGYDRDGNRKYRENTVNPAFSELYHGGGPSGGYDNLNQLTKLKRGTLNAAKDDLTGTPSRTQSWALDAAGNWNSLTTDSVTETRDHNKQNEVTRVGSSYPAFDNNGNTTTDQSGKTFIYDAC